MRITHSNTLVNGPHRAGLAGAGLVGAGLVSEGRVGKGLAGAGLVGGGLVIGLVNNMPPAALRAAEQQFRALVAAAPGAPVRLRVFVDRAAHPCPSEAHEDLDALWNAQLDGLIVTGTEPRARAMTGEPLWPGLAAIADWACENTLSTIWSCMAAHAAAYRLDGVERVRLPEKLWGVFACARASDHPLVADASARWPVPHSRRNALDERDLIGAGYRILSRAPRVGADIFIKQARQSLFVMAQGHPEYGPDSLLREYRREVKRFLDGQRDHYPEMPEGYFDQAATARFTALRDAIATDPATAPLDLLSCGGGFAPVRDWSTHATRLYARWLSLLAGRKAETSRPSRVRVAA